MAQARRNQGAGLGCALALAALAAGCSDEPPREIDQPPAQQQPAAGTFIEAEPQRDGDPELGYTALVTEPYVSCGIPYSVHKLAFGTAPESMRLDGREGRNAEMHYSQTFYTTDQGVELVTANCLGCHADSINGELIIGLGSHSSDFTNDSTVQASLAGALITDPLERAEYEKWASRVNAVGPHVIAPTRGVSVAENITAVLIAHRDRHTLAWFDEPLLPLPPPHVVPVDVPPWWRMKKKNAMFYLGQGRGDHARIMMTASALCTDTVDDAKAIDSYFPHVRAYIESIQSPAYPWDVDAGLAAEGETVFDAHCARCHGSYGDEPSYPNLRIALADIGTDSVLAQASTHLTQEFVDWYAESFYGEISRIEAAEGYVAPPLDGVWATAPFLHNGSVPTIQALLDSSKRPKFWQRASFTGNDYDTSVLGFAYHDVGHGHADEPDDEARKNIYDTTLLGYGNGGHLFGDVLTDTERTAVIEYLKTL